MGLDAWIIQDGNYPDFHRAQQAEFAVEFNFLDRPVLQKPSKPTAALASGPGYDVVANVVAILDDCWVIDCGLRAYQAGRPRQGISLGDCISGRVYLGVDPFFYFEELHWLAGMPPLIYTWRIDGLLRQTAPFIEVAPRTWKRDPTKLDFEAIEATDAWHDDGGSGSYVLECLRLDLPPRADRITTH